MRPKLVHDPVSLDVVGALEDLLAGAREGRIVGIVFGALMRGRQYHVAATGSLIRDPTLARGIIAALDDELAAIVHSRADAGPTL